MQLKRLVSAAVLTLVGASLAACGTTTSSPASNPTIVVGSASFPESEILADIYADALNAEGIKATTKLDLGQREQYLPLIKDGTVSLLPEYTGNLLLNLDPAANEVAAGRVVPALVAALPAGLTVLKPSLAQDQDTYNVTAAMAQKYDLRTIADLVRVANAGPAGGLRVAGNPELNTRPYGPAGLARVYRLKIAKFTAIPDSGGTATLKALSDGSIDVADVFSTSPQIALQHLFTLADPLHLIGPQNIVPLIRKDHDSAAVEAVLNAVSAQLSTPDLQILLSKLSGPGAQTAAQVAQAWVDAHGFGSAHGSSTPSQGSFHEPGAGPTH
jgi:osmoprotectant transport system substrate-binding protein